MGEVVVETQCITQRGDNMSDASEISASSGESRLKRQRTDAMSEGGDGARVIVPVWEIFMLSCKLFFF